MKKIAVTLSLVIVLVFATFGGLAVAAPQQTPSDCCRYLMGVLDEILATLSDTEYEVSETGEDVDYIVSEVEEIDYEVEETGDDVDYIVSEVEEIGYEVEETGDDVDYIVSEVEEIGYEVEETGDDVDYIVSEVEEIGYEVEETGDDVDYIVSEVEEIGYEVEETGDDVDYIVTEVSSVVRMDTDYGTIEIPPGTKLGTETVTGGDYDEIRHVVVTLYIDGTLDEADDGIYVRAYWPENLDGCIVASFFSGSSDVAETFEFNADEWTIDCESGRTGYTVQYVVTSTYVPGAP